MKGGNPARRHLDRALARPRFAAHSSLRQSLRLARPPEQRRVTPTARAGSAPPAFRVPFRQPPASSAMTRSSAAGHVGAREGNGARQRENPHQGRSDSGTRALEHEGCPPHRREPRPAPPPPTPPPPPPPPPPLSTRRHGSRVPAADSPDRLEESSAPGDSGSGIPPPLYQVDDGTPRPPGSGAAGCVFAERRDSLSRIVEVRLRCEPGLRAAASQSRRCRRERATTGVRRRGPLPAGREIVSRGNRSAAIARGPQIRVPCPSARATSRLARLSTAPCVGVQQRLQRRRSRTVSSAGRPPVNSRTWPFSDR
jgi:hypothetical protein